MGDGGEHKGVQPPSHLLEVTDKVVELVRRVTRTGRKTIRHLSGRSPAHLGAWCVLKMGCMLLAIVKISAERQAASQASGGAR